MPAMHKKSDEAAREDEAVAPPGPATSVVLLHELARAEDDVLALGERHGVGLAKLSAWAALPKTQRTVAGLCLLADLQTQLLLSRYRLVAASRLVAQATGQDDTLGPEQVRKACVDLLKIELDRVASVSLEAVDALDDPAFESLKRAMLEGGADEPKPGDGGDESV
ncbi:MAG: hypothetical protein ACIAXF_02380 [Phycisphaerales bacterium JB063]